MHEGDDSLLRYFQELEARAKTASETRRQSKRKRELMIARELEKQHQQAREVRKDIIVFFAAEFCECTRVYWSKQQE